MTEIRLSPSGPVIENATGGPFDPGSGARLRLAESQIVIGGSLLIPSNASPASEQAISEDGFGAPATANPLVVQLASPKAGLSYRANLRLDVQNLDPTTLGAVLLLLDTSIDGGANWVNQVQSLHYVYPNTYLDGEVTEPGNSRQTEVTMTTTLGSALGVIATTPSLSVRVRAQAAVGPGSLFVSSPASEGELTLDGSCLLWLEEVF